MAATPESLVKKQVRRILDEEGAYALAPMGTGYGNSGVLDINACCNGLFIAVECKAGKGKTTALQDEHIRRIRAAGGIALVINETNLQELRNALCSMKNMR